MDEGKNQLGKHHRKHYGRPVLHLYTKNHVKLQYEQTPVKQFLQGSIAEQLPNQTAGYDIQIIVECQGTGADEFIHRHSALHDNP